MERLKVNYRSQQAPTPDSDSKISQYLLQLHMHLQASPDPSYRMFYRDKKLWAYTSPF
eukprot:c40169_g1_i1 orf=243-416(+)